MSTEGDVSSTEWVATGWINNDAVHGHGATEREALLSLAGHLHEMVYGTPPCDNPDSDIFDNASLVSKFATGKVFDDFAPTAAMMWGALADAYGEATVNKRPSNAVGTCNSTSHLSAHLISSTGK